MELMIMQYLLWAFTAGVFAGGLLLGFGFLLGKLHSSRMDKLVNDQQFDPDHQAMDDEFFDQQWNSDKEIQMEDGEFPSDEVLAELDRLHRHSEF